MARPRRANNVADEGQLQAALQSLDALTAFSSTTAVKDKLAPTF